MKPKNYALPCPLPSSRLIPGAIRLVQMRDVGNERVVGVGIRQHRADRKEHWQGAESAYTLDRVSQSRRRSIPHTDRSYPIVETIGLRMEGMRDARQLSSHVPFEIVNAGLHWSLKMSRQIEPFALMFGW